MPYEDEQEEELSLLDIFNIVWRRKWLIFILTVIFGSLGAYIAFTSPFIYRAECRITPPPTQGRSSGILAQLGGIADLVGFSGSATSGQMMIGILKGNTVVDAIIDKFNLMEEYQQELRLTARNATLKNLEADEDSKSGIITVAFLDKSPDRAADIANAFVSELGKKLQELAINDATQKRNFFESQLMQAQQELSAAENDLINYQQSKGVISFEAQTEAILSSIASLRNRIAAKNVEISTLSSYARRDNPRLRLAQSELDAMNKELRKLEEEQQKSDRYGRGTSSDLLSSIGQMPELGIEYQKYMRTLRFAAAKYEMMLRQYENARLSEASDISTIQIIDPATPPDYKYLPKRARILILWTMAGFALGVFWAFMSDYLRKLKEKKDGDDYDD